MTTPTLNVRDLGAKGDGATDDGHPIRVAARDGAGGTIVFPPGVYYYRAIGPLNLKAGTTLVGEPGKTVILFDARTPGTHTEFARNNGDGVTITGLTVRRVSTFPTIMLPLRPYTGLTIRDCVFDGGQDTHPGTYAHGLELGAHNGETRDLDIRDSTFTGFDYPLFQANDSTGATHGIKVTGCTFTRNHYTDLEFNAPNADITYVRVRDCDFTDNLRVVAGAGFGVGLAHVTIATIRDNTFTGYGNEAVHVEDHSRHITIDGNTFTDCGTDRAAHIRVISGSTGVRVTGNHLDATSNTNTIHMIHSTAGGAGLTPGGRPFTHPTRLVVTGNLLATGPRCHGVYASFADDSVFTGNTITGDTTGHAVHLFGGRRVVVVANTGGGTVLVEGG